MHSQLGLSVPEWLLRLPLPLVSNWGSSAKMVSIVFNEKPQKDLEPAVRLHGQ
jgi:hypothetical protein